MKAKVNKTDKASKVFTQLTDNNQDRLTKMAEQLLETQHTANDETSNMSKSASKQENKVE
jgi:hypothetical protein